MATTTTQASETHLQPPPLAERVADCLRRHLAGDRDAMADLTRQVTPWLHRVVRTFRLPRDAADDVVQSTLLAMLSHLHEVREPTSGLAWMSVVAHREALRVIRAERRYVSVDTLESLPVATAAGPDEIVLAIVYRDIVLRTLSKLPPRHRVLLRRLARPDRPSYATISAELQMPQGSIGPTRRRALERMRRILASDPEWDTGVPA
jgi:RNA polymerase sigma factor (sigma-70 family)